MKKYIRMQQFIQICMNLKIIPVLIIKDLLTLNDLNNIICYKMNLLTKDQNKYIGKINNVLIGSKMFILFFTVNFNRQFLIIFSKK